MSTHDEPERYLSKRQFADRIGASDPTLSGYKLPPPNVTIGPVNDDGTIPRGTVQGWTEERIDEWQRSRPGRGARTDLNPFGDEALQDKVARFKQRRKDGLAPDNRTFKD
ncbi:hypothetical protein [Rhodococcoides fascians]|uniref:hypothetical protein n=1 Tax=Rhodococcoides fascians TaxID=1828 RepID=UPI00211AF669|nr:hypothetical protein [Rhodococcus fascians]